jgi:hypothetical protein
MKRIITLLVICLLLTTNLQAQTMSKNGSFHCQYHEEDTTATIFVHFVGGGNTIYDNNLVIPDYVEKEGGDGTKYTVTTWGSGGYSGAIGWQGGSPDRPSHINVYIPKTLKKITSNVFSNHGNRLYAQFNFFFEDEEVYNYLTEWYEIHQNYVWMGRLSHKIGDFELEENWFVDSNGFYMRGIFKWNRVYKTNIQNVSVSNVNYRIDNGVIYFDEAVNNIQLYDLQGRLLYHNKNTGTLNIGNNLKGVYLLKYDDKTTKIIF